MTCQDARGRGGSRTRNTMEGMSRHGYSTERLTASTYGAAVPATEEVHDGLKAK